MWYAGFCVVTAIHSLFSIFYPVLQLLKESQPLNPMSQSPFMGMAVLTIIAMLVSPVLFMACIVPEFGEQFKATLLTSLES